ncbi:50S ribosomal protein L22 [Flavicella sp.]|uniref:50S ribosomal protein L22 n=1 Tax=Flavicella sp. TaxID=2957742 RepID=UPI003018EE9B
MGVRKKNMADQRKEGKKTIAFAKLTNCPTSPRKMRLVVDLVRGLEVEKALQILKFSSKEASINVEKLLLSAIANWQAKNEESSIEEARLFIKEISVDSAGMLKRLRPAPQGRAHRIRKRSNHVTIVLGSKNNATN